MSGSGRQRVFSSFDRPRRRFVQDGEVPVTVIHPRPRQGLEALGPPRPGVSPLERAESAEAALAGERSAREQAERLLREAQATILDLRTKQGHAELARVEAADAAEALRNELATLRAELGTTRAALAAAEEAARAAAAAPTRGRRKSRFVLVEPTEVESQWQADAPEPEAPPPEATKIEAPRPEAPVRRGPGRPRSAAPKPVAKPKPAAKAKPVKWWLKPATAAKRAKPAAKSTAKPAAKRAGRPPVRRRSPRAF